MSARNWGKLQDGLAASYDQKWAAGSSQYGQLSPIDHQKTAVVPATRTTLSACIIIKSCEVFDI
jgi:hypothetical protein